MNIFTDSLRYGFSKLPIPSLLLNHYCSVNKLKIYTCIIEEFGGKKYQYAFNTEAYALLEYKTQSDSQTDLYIPENTHVWEVKLPNNVIFFINNDYKTFTLLSDSTVVKTKKIAIADLEEWKKLDFCQRAVQNNGHNIRFIRESIWDVTELRLALIKREAIKGCVDERVIKEKIKRWWKIQVKDLQQMAIHENADSILSIPPKDIENGLILQALKKNPHLFSSIQTLKKISKSTRLDLICQDPDIILQFNNQTEREIRFALKIDPDVFHEGSTTFNRIIVNSPKLQLDMIYMNHTHMFCISNLTMEASILAVKLDPININYLVPRLIYKYREGLADYIRPIDRDRCEYNMRLKG